MSIRDYIIMFEKPTTGRLTYRYPSWDSPTRIIKDDQEFFDESIARAFSQYGVEAYPILSSEVKKQDRYFRDALHCVDGKPEFNHGECEVLHMDEIRRVRNEELVARDITFMRAVEAGDTDAQATIATEKQVLRDLPATFDITTDVDTLEKLKAKWPTELPDRE